MKKVFYFAAVCAALVGCAKVEVREYVPDAKPIVFNSPVVGVPTKTTGPVEGTLFPDNISFNVWAVYSISDLSFSSIATASNWGNYIGTSGGAGVTVAPVGSPVTHWAPATAVYWPKAGGKLTFQAVSPSTFGAQVDFASHTISTATSFTVGTDDIMFSEINANQVESNYTGGNKPDNDDDSGDYKYDGVDLLFHHALAQIQFKVKKHTQCSGTEETITIKNITVSGAKITAPGGVTITNSTGFSGTTNYAVTWNGTFTGSGSYVFKNSTQSVPVPENTSDPVVVPYNGVNTQNGVLVLPQTIADDVTVTVTYTSTIGDVTSSEATTAAVQLNSLRTSSAAVSTWEWGKKYIYTIYFKENGIIFDPAVVTWDTVDVDADTNAVS